MARCRGGGVEDHDAASRVRIEACEGVRDHPAVVVSGNVDLLQFQQLQQLVDVRGHVRGIEAAGRCGGTADAARIDGDHGEGLRQTRHDLVIGVPILRKSVQEDHGRPSSTASVVKRHSVQFRGPGEPRPELGRRRVDALLARRLAVSSAPSQEHKNDRRPQKIDLHAYGLRN